MIHRLAILLIMFLASTSCARRSLRAEEHAGLLGRRTATLNTGAWRFSGFDESSRSAEFSLNIPAPWTDSLGTTLSHDLFVSGGVANGFNYMKFVGIDSGLDYSVNVPVIDDDSDYVIDNVGDDGGLSFTDPLVVDDTQEILVRTVVRGRSELTIYSAAIGTTIYLSTLRDFRPYLQVGYRYSDVRSAGRTTTGRSIQSFDLGYYVEEDRFSELSHYVILNPGFEYDIADVMSLRAQFNANVKDGFDQSSVSAGLTWWPQSSWFVNLSGRTLVDGGGQGVSFASGFRF